MINADNTVKFWISPALYGVVAFLPFSIAFSEICILITLLGVLAHIAITHSFGEFKSSLLYAVAAYILISLVSALLCKINPKSLNEVGHMLLYIFLFASIYLGRKGIFTKGHLYVLIAALAFGALNGIVQYFNDTGILGRHAPHNPGIPPRIRGTFSNSMTYSGFYGMALFFLMPLLKTRIRWLKMFVAAAVLLLLAAVVLSYARGALLATIVTSFVLVVRQRKYLLHFLVAVVVIAIVSYFLLPELVSRMQYAFSGDAGFSTYKLRLLYAEAAWDFFTANPFFGIGPGAFTAAYEIWKPSADFLPAAHAHNEYLEALSTRGILGLLAFLTILAVIFRKLGSSIRKLGENEAHPLVRGTFYGLLFLCIASLFECHFADEEIFNFFSLVVGLGLGLSGKALAEFDSA
ncbi:MAG: O-antigen ligase family protein [Candidatus Zixiibacteriota bacterium]